jgi:rare lipoprotein A
MDLTPSAKRRLMGLSRVIISCCIVALLASCASYETYPESSFAVASWYGPEFHGKPTSSGDIFDMYAFTCAHREYPFGTQLKITHTSNNKSVNCLVNDRGPFVAGRDLDLSYAAAKEIGLIEKGTATVKVEYLGRKGSYLREVRYLADSGPFTIQVGSFRELLNAIRMKASLELKYSEVYIVEANVEGIVHYRVHLGKFTSRKEAYDLARKLADEGYGVLVTGFDQQTSVSAPLW